MELTEFMMEFVDSSDGRTQLYHPSITAESAAELEVSTVKKFKLVDRGYSKWVAVTSRGSFLVSVPDFERFRRGTRCKRLDL